MIRYPRAEPINKARIGRLHDAVAPLIGKPLAGARYRFPAGTPWPQGYARGQLDEVDMAVAVDFADGVTLLCSWAMEGFAEGIDVEAGPGQTFPVVAEREGVFVASESGPWSGLCGDVLSTISATWQLRSEYAPETVWAMRLAFASGRTVVIALGVVRQGLVEYQPDGLVVLFDEKQADAYREEYESQAGMPPSAWQPIAVEPEGSGG